MTGTNHVLTGAGVALFISTPAVALPVAFVSHFILDALPHFGVAYDKVAGRRPKIFSYVTWTDAVIVCVLLVTAIVLHSWLALACMIAALSPDFVWIYKYVFREKFGSLPPSPKGPVSQFHKAIQQYERHWGLYIEIGFAIVLGAVIWNAK